MSSHHIVREGQEPALFILEDTSYERIAALLEWSPLIMATAETLERVLSWGIRIDTVVCEPENRPQVEALIGDMQQVDIVEAMDQLLEGLRWLWAHDQVAVTVAGTDLRNLERIELSSSHRISFIDSTTRWIPVAGEFKKWVPAGTTFKILHNSDASELTVNDERVHGDRITSKQDGLMIVQSSRLLWLGEEL